MNELSPDIVAVAVVSHGVLRLSFAGGLTAEIEVLHRMQGPVFTEASTAGSMPDSVKVHDLDRDGRFALHNTPAPEAEWTGDAKLTGVAHPTTGPRQGARYYRLDLREVATVGVDADALAISVWTPQRGVRSWTR